jgi:transcriptional regulator with PAS, ATPase and Fis domain
MKKEATATNEDLTHKRQQLESQYIADVLAQYDDDFSRAAQALRISLPALLEKMKAYRFR